MDQETGDQSNGVLRGGRRFRRTCALPGRAYAIAGTVAESIPRRRALHKNHGKVPETGGFRPGSGDTPDTKIPQGGWEGKQTFALKGLLVQSPAPGARSGRKPLAAL